MIFGSVDTDLGVESFKSVFTNTRSFQFLTLSRSHRNFYCVSRFEFSRYYCFKCFHHKARVEWSAISGVVFWLEKISNKLNCKYFYTIYTSLVKLIANISDDVKCENFWSFGFQRCQSPRSAKFKGRLMLHEDNLWCLSLSGLKKRMATTAAAAAAAATAGYGKLSGREDNVFR